MLMMGDIVNICFNYVISFDVKQCESSIFCLGSVDNLFVCQSLM